MALSKKKKLVGLVGTTAALVSIAGIGFAVWSTTGTGSGGAAAAIAQGVTVTAVTPTGAAANLYPGGPAGSVDFTITNPNPYAVTLTAITWGTPISTNTTTCPNANLSIDANAPKTLSITMPANANPSSTFVIPGVLDLAHAAPDGCEGVAFVVPVTVTGSQQ